ncbi:acyl-CoA dehydrogenase family protein [Nocardioides sp.]|uniref:acyl-CoA dehydrogenase family protein n=1 Tax=Nocardioides sp. TaxID=35761 RepID=UPI00261BD574|nr:acyl-CoA dehydrogenase family protein [Nocardioides sp.]
MSEQMQTGAPRHTGLLDRIAAVADVLRKDAPACDEIGRATALTEDALRSTGVVKFLHPADFGGLEGHPTEFLEGCVELASISSAAGWIAGVVGVHPHEVALADRRLQEEIWGEGTELGAETWIASPYAPGGVAVPTEGGYLFTGRWGYSSGTDLCQWVTIGGWIADADGEVRDRSGYHFALPRSDYEIVGGSWEVFGLRGTGSKDLVVKDAFVPSYRVIPTEEITEGSAAVGAGRGDAPIYYLPRNVMFAGAVTAATVGIAKGVVDTVLEINRERQARHGKASQDPFQLAALGRATAEVDSAVVQILHDMDRAYAYCLRGELVPLSVRAEIRRNQAAASQRAAKAADDVFRISGGVGMYAEFGLERRWRDSQAALHHIHNLAEPVWQSWGLLHFGFPGIPTVKF